MRRPRGFTLIEIVIVLSVVAIVAAAGVMAYTSATRNAQLAGATHELAVRLTGLKARALSEGRDLLLVFADAPGGDASRCSGTTSATCSRYYILRDPAATWLLSDFDPASPTDDVEAILEEQLLPRGAHLAFAVTPPAIAPPFNTIAVHDSDLTAVCAGGRACFALRFTARGDVRAEFAAGAPMAKPGYAFLLASELETAAAARRGVLVSFPSGIVRSFAF
jgi:prepilin-type N-terminal cleavage/methylation domain-containing protein